MDRLKVQVYNLFCYRCVDFFPNPTTFQSHVCERSRTHSPHGSSSTFNFNNHNNYSNSINNNNERSYQNQKETNNINSNDNDEEEDTNFLRSVTDDEMEEMQEMETEMEMKERKRAEYRERLRIQKEKQQQRIKLESVSSSSSRLNSKGYSSKRKNKSESEDDDDDDDDEEEEDSEENQDSDDSFDYDDTNYKPYMGPYHDFQYTRRRTRNLNKRTATSTLRLKQLRERGFYRKKSDRILSNATNASKSNGKKYKTRNKTKIKATDSNQKQTQEGREREIKAKLLKTPRLAELGDYHHCIKCYQTFYRFRDLVLHFRGCQLKRKESFQEFMKDAEHEPQQKKSQHQHPQQERHKKVQPMSRFTREIDKENRSKTPNQKIIIIKKMNKINVHVNTCGSDVKVSPEKDKNCSSLINNQNQGKNQHPILYKNHYANQHQNHHSKNQNQYQNLHKSPNQHQQQNHNKSQNQDKNQHQNLVKSPPSNPDKNRHANQLPQQQNLQRTFHYEQKRKLPNSLPAPVPAVVVVAKRQNDDDDDDEEEIDPLSLCRTEIEDKSVCEDLNVELDCQFCPFSSTSREELYIHVQSHSSFIGLHPCRHKFCGASFATESELQHHVGLHLPREWRCLVPGCPFSFTQAQPLEDHIMKNHPEEYPKYGKKKRMDEYVDSIVKIETDVT